MFINYSNHPSPQWSEAQLAAAEKYGEIIDIPFMQVDPYLSSEQVRDAAAAEAEIIMGYHPDVVMCQGEMTLSYHIVAILKAKGIPVVGATSERKVVEQETVDGKQFEDLMEGRGGEAEQIASGTDSDQAE